MTPPRASRVPLPYAVTRLSRHVSRVWPRQRGHHPGNVTHGDGRRWGTVEAPPVEGGRRSPSASGNGVPFHPRRSKPLRLTSHCLNLALRRAQGECRPRRGCRQDAATRAPPQGARRRTQVSSVAGLNRRVSIACSKTDQMTLAEAQRSQRPNRNKLSCEVVHGAIPAELWRGDDEARVSIACSKAEEWTLAKAQRSQRTDENEGGREVVDAAIAVHRELGPGLLEPLYGVVLLDELRKRRLEAQHHPNRQRSR